MQNSAHKYNSEPNCGMNIDDFLLKTPMSDINFKATYRAEH